MFETMDEERRARSSPSSSHNPEDLFHSNSGDSNLSAQVAKIKAGHGGHKNAEKPPRLAPWSSSSVDDDTARTSVKRSKKKKDPKAKLPRAPRLDLKRFTPVVSSALEKRDARERLEEETETAKQAVHRALIEDWAKFAQWNENHDPSEPWPLFVPASNTNVTAAASAVHDTFCKRFVNLFGGQPSREATHKLWRDALRYVNTAKAMIIANNKAFQALKLKRVPAICM
jgi:hypothetical protein